MEVSEMEERKIGQIKEELKAATVSQWPEQRQNGFIEEESILRKNILCWLHKKS